MGKPKKKAAGFSNPKAALVQQQPTARNSADHCRQEQEALSLVNQGRLKEAEAIYRELITAGTSNHIVYGNLAAICGMKGRAKEMIKLLKRTIELDPKYADAHYNLGNAFKEQGDLTAAIASYNKALEQNPNDPETHNNLAVSLQEQGDITAAINSYKKALELNPNALKTHYNLGNALKEQGDLTAAIASYNKALKLNPIYADAQQKLGDALKEQGDLTAAIASYNKVLELNPNDPETHNNLAVSLQEQGDITAAINSYNKALELDPKYSDAHYNLGNALREQGDITAAIDSYNNALEFNPNDPDTHNNLGNALQGQGDITAAIASYIKALEFNNNALETYNNLGNALQEQGDITAAIASYNKALELNPNHPETLGNLSMAELLTGDYKSGWERYECRSKVKSGRSILNVNPSLKKWDGRKIPIGHRLLLVSEQGLGDTLQFMRYVIALAKQDIAVDICAQPKLHKLIQSSGIHSSPLTPEQASQVTDGHWISLLSVPRHLEVSPDNPIITKPYIKTTDELIVKWRDILAGEKRPVIGINWQGNPFQETTNSIGRSLPLTTFATIASKANATLLSLQKGFGSDQLETCSFKDRFVNCQDQINDTWDFQETAAIIANCDLVITSDTSVAHLAGGIGRTTWLLLKKVPEWRWGLAGDTTFWYPSMRLFRQREQGNWDEVMERVAEELQKQFGYVSTTTQTVPLLQQRASCR